MDGAGDITGWLLVKGVVKVFISLLAVGALNLSCVLLLERTCFLWISVLSLVLSMLLAFLHLGDSAGL